MDGQNQNPMPPQGPTRFEPNTEVSMQGQPTGPRPAAPAQPFSVQPVATVPAPAQVTPTPPAVAQPADGFASGFDEFDAYVATADEVSNTPDATVRQEMSWSAPEFEKRSKSKGWYVSLVIIAVVIAGVAFLINRDLVTIIVVLICAGLFGYVAARDPREMHYALGPSGIYVGERLYSYGQFSAFSVAEQATSLSIDLMPLKRFSPVLSLSYTPEIEPELLELLSRHLPYANHKRSLTEDLMHRIHF